MLTSPSAARFNGFARRLDWPMFYCVISHGVDQFPTKPEVDLILQIFDLISNQSYTEVYGKQEAVLVVDELHLASRTRRSITAGLVSQLHLHEPTDQRHSPPR